MKLTTSPKHWLDYVLWPLLRLVWEPFSLKRSHFWHWRDYPVHYQLSNTVGFSGSPDARPIRGWFSNLWQTNFGWKLAATLEGPAGMDYHLGFETVENGKTVQKICSIVLRGKCAALIGSADVRFFMVSVNGKTSVPIAPRSEGSKFKLVAGVTLV